DPQRDLDRGWRAGGADNDAALDSDPRGDPAGVEIAVARRAGDGRLIAHVAADRLLAGCGDRIGRGAGANLDVGTGQPAGVRSPIRRGWRGVIGRLSDAEQRLETVGD